LIDTPDELPRPSDDELVAPDTYEGDAELLKRNFSGKSVIEAIRMFEQRTPANIAEDFLFMSHKALAYYLPAALAYLTGPSSEGDGEFLDWVTAALSIRRERDRLLPAEAKQLIREIARYVKEHLQKFSCCKDPAHELGEYMSRLESMSESG
jgi:hypothetical protein